MRFGVRPLSREMILRAVDSVEMIESYPEDKYLPSYLIRSVSDSAVFHVQIATDLDGDNIRIVTAYIPDPKKMERGLQNTEKTTMMCRTCGGAMSDRITDIPFKTGESTIVIIKGLPVIQCQHCNEYAFADPIMDKVEQILASVDKTAELEVVRYAA